MKNYIVTITKALNKQSKVEVLASSKKEIIELSETQFGLGIAPFTENEITLKSELSGQRVEEAYVKRGGLFGDFYSIV